MPKAIMLIGHQYTGKSTWVADFGLASMPDQPTAHYNLDLYVHSLLEDQGLPYNNDNWALFVRRANAYLEENFRIWLNDGNNLIIDRTNMTKRTRMVFLKRLRDHGYDIEAVIFPNLDDAEIERRHSLRPNQTVPISVVKSFRDSFENIDEEELKFYRSVKYIDPKNPTN